MQSPKRATFALDENFPQPILREAINKYVVGIEIVLLVDLDPSLAGEALLDLADDYGLTLAQIEAAVRLEVQLLEPERIAA